MADHKKNFSHLLKESILELCNARLSHDETLEIDGVICVTVGDNDENHIVIKVHETIVATSYAENTTSLIEKVEDINDTITPYVPQEHSVVADLRNLTDENGQPCSLDRMEMEKTTPLDASEARQEDTAIIKSETPEVESSGERSTSVPEGDPVRYTCGVCDDVFPTRSGLEKHNRIHTGDGPYKCTACHLRFREAETLQRHMAGVHNLPPVQGKSSRQFQCEICGRVLLSRQSLKHHVLAVHEGISRPQKKGLCAFCGKICRTATALKEHQNKWHFDIKPFPCKKCGRAFHAKPVLRVHEKQAHSDVRNFPCEACGKAFKRHSDLKDHLLTHSETRPYQCDICKKRYKKKPVLTRHYRLHTGLKPFECKVCSASFADASILRRHVIAIHKVPRDKWHKDLTAEDLHVMAETPNLSEVSPDKRKRRPRTKRKTTRVGQVVCNVPTGDVLASADQIISPAGEQFKPDMSGDITDDVENTIVVIQQSIPAAITERKIVDVKREIDVTTGDSVTTAAAVTTDEPNPGCLSGEKTIQLVEDESGNLITWDSQMMSFEQVYILVNDPVVQSTEELVTTDN